MKRLLSLSSVLSFLFLCFTLASPPVFSQQATNSAVPTTDTTPTSVERQKSDYFYNLEQYRQAHQQFLLDQAEYEKLQTLATGEKLVTSYRTLLTSRAETLRTYLYPLQSLLFSSQGIDIQDKQKALDQLDEVLILIKKHTQNIPSLTTKNQASQESARFETEDTPLFLEASYRALSLLSIGRIQSISDQVLISTRDFEQEIVAYESDARRKAAMERGLTEINLLHSQATSAIDQSRTTFSGFDPAEDQHEKTDPAAIYQQIIDQLNPAYTDLHRALDYLIELDNS